MQDVHSVGALSLFHNGMMARVFENRVVLRLCLSQWCQTYLNSGAVQLAFTEMLPTVICMENAGIMIKLRTGHFFNLQHLKANSKVEEAIVCDFSLANHCVIDVEIIVQLQHLANCFSTTSMTLGLRICMKRTRIMPDGSWIYQTRSNLENQ